MANTNIRIGSLYAHIPGDFRYNDLCKVEYNPENDTVRVRVFTTGAVGGMDGGRSDSYEPMADFDQSTAPKPTAKVVVALIKKAIGNDRFLFKRYGKPTKNFSWGLGIKGLSTRCVGEALKIVCGQ